MYEFIAADGRRITIRSVRTLGQLLQNGQIKAETQFRLADEAEFSAASEHPHLLNVASQLGFKLGPPAATPPFSTSNQTALPPASTHRNPFTPETLLPTLKPNASVPPAIPSVVAANATRASVPATPARTVIAPPSQRIDAAPQNPARATDRAHTAAAAFATSAVLTGALVIGVVAGLVAGGMTKSAVVGWLVTVAGASWSARLGARKLAFRTPSITSFQVAAGSAVFLAACLLGGWSGVIVGAPTCAVLWSTLGKPIP